jgi:hypothetical protein
MARRLFVSAGKRERWAQEDITLDGIRDIPGT